MLAGAHLLRPACAGFRVYIAQAELDRVRVSLQVHEHQQATFTWLSELLARVSQGIDAGTYALLPDQPEDDAMAEAADRAEFRGLLALLRFVPQPGDMIWVDDRRVDLSTRQVRSP
jgi:hypothetical protein